VTGEAEDVDHVLIDAIHDRRLVAVLSDPASAGLDPAHPSVVAALAAMSSVGALARLHADRVRSALTSDGVDAAVLEPDARLQLASVGVVVDRSDVDGARRTLERAGYEPVRRLSPGAWRALTKWSSSFLFAATDGSSVQLDVRWGTPRQWSRGRRAIAPAGPQLSRVDLPSAAWPLYSVVRVYDLGVRAVRRQSRDRDLGPHLPTPDALVEPMLDLASVGADDLLLDVGCGEGHVVIAAAHSRGCRGLGIELDDELVASARRSATVAGVADRVEFSPGDVVEADLAGVSVAFVFLPARALPAVIGSLTESLPAGATIVAHELDRLVDVRRPERSVPLFADGAISVAHRWTT
jgi:hypothetical protein